MVDYGLLTIDVTTGGLLRTKPPSVMARALPGDHSLLPHSLFATSALFPTWKKCRGSSLSLGSKQWETIERLLSPLLPIEREAAVDTLPLGWRKRSNGDHSLSVAAASGSHLPPLATAVSTVLPLILSEAAWHWQLAFLAVASGTDSLLCPCCSLPLPGETPPAFPGISPPFPTTRLPRLPFTFAETQWNGVQPGPCNGTQPGVFCPGCHLASSGQDCSEEAKGWLQGESTVLHSILTPPCG